MRQDALTRITTTEPAVPIYEALLQRLESLGPHQIEPKQTSVHITNGTAFLGIAPRRQGLVLTVVSADPLTGPRIRHSERASKTRCYNDILLTSADDVDDELLGWIGQSYLRTSR